MGVDMCLLNWWRWLSASGVVFQAEDGIRDLVRSRGLGDVYKRQVSGGVIAKRPSTPSGMPSRSASPRHGLGRPASSACLLYTSDAADERSSVDLGGRRTIKKKKVRTTSRSSITNK